MYAKFSYAELDRAVEQLRLELPDVSPASARGLEFLGAHMPERIKAPPEEKPVVNHAKLSRGAGKVARAARDERIREAAREGRSPTELASAFGLGLTTVYTVCNRRPVNGQK